MRYRAIQEHDRRYPIRLMCRALAVSPAGYCAWAGRPERDRSMQNRARLSAIRVIHRESRETYGSPSIWDALIKQGHGVGKHRIARLMRVEGIRAKTVKKWRATTQANHRLPALNGGQVLQSNILAFSWLAAGVHSDALRSAPSD